MALQESAEAYLVSLFEDTNLAVSCTCPNSLVSLLTLLFRTTGHPCQASHHPAKGYSARSTTQRREVDTASFSLLRLILCYDPSSFVFSHCCRYYQYSLALAISAKLFMKLLACFSTSCACKVLIRRCKITNLSSWLFCRCPETTTNPNSNQSHSSSPSTRSSGISATAAAALYALFSTSGFALFCFFG